MFCSITAKTSKLSHLDEAFEWGLKHFSECCKRVCNCKLDKETWRNLPNFPGKLCLLHHSRTFQQTTQTCQSPAIKFLRQGHDTHSKAWIQRRTSFTCYLYVCDLFSSRRWQKTYVPCNFPASGVPSPHGIRQVTLHRIKTPRTKNPCSGC